MIKVLLRSLREFKKAAITAPLLVIGEALMEVIMPLLTAYLIDEGIDIGSMPGVLKWGALTLAACVLSLLFGVLSGKYASVAACGFSRNLRHDMFERVQQFSFANIDKFSTSSLVTRMTTDVTNIQMAVMMLLRMAVRAPIMIVFSMSMAFTLNAKLALIFLACIPVLGFALFFIAAKAHPRFERVFHTYDTLNNVVQEDVRGIRVVKSFVREDHERRKFSDVSASIYEDFSAAEGLTAFNQPVMSFVMYSCMILISWLGARMIVQSVLTTGQLMSLITYALSALMSLQMLAMIWVMVTISRASVERVTEVLTEESSLRDGERHLCTVKDGSVRFDHVSFAYHKGKDVIRELTLSIPSGATVGVIGGTGSAKSSLVQLIPRLYDVTEGTLYVGGEDVRDYDIEALRSEVAMVLQKNVLFSGTIAENLRWGNEDAPQEELERVCRLAQADEFIEQLDGKYEYRISQGGDNVSGGQKQRLCIARALLKKPKILILDDSTSAVDTATDAKIRQAFREEIPDTTKIIIAQRIASVQDADLILVMDGGKLADAGTHEELLARSPIYSEVYHSQNKEAAVHA